MTNLELLLNSLAEASTTEISRKENPKGMGEASSVARRGGNVAKTARTQLEEQLGHTIITSAKASDYLPPIESGDAKQLE